MKVEAKHFYFIKDQFFDKIQDNQLLQNKENGNKRPCYYCFKEKEDHEISWFIPVSSKVEKYKKIYIRKLKRYRKVDTIVFGKVKGKENVFLIQNMFPILEEYIEGKYMYNNKPIEITYSLQQEIETKANKILSLVKIREEEKRIIIKRIINSNVNM